MNRRGVSRWYTGPIPMRYDYTITEVNVFEVLNWIVQNAYKCMYLYCDSMKPYRFFPSNLTG